MTHPRHDTLESAAEPASTDTERERLDAMFQMLATSEDVARLMAGVKQQFITTAGYTPANAETCAILLWQSALPQQSVSIDQAAQAERAAAELQEASEWRGRFIAAVHSLLTALRFTAAGWVVHDAEAFSAAINTILGVAGITHPAQEPPA